MENYKNSKIGRETAQKYGDILEMERPQTEESLRKHPRMTLQNRAKIFSPFSPLRGYDEQLAAEKQRTERVPKRILTEEEMSALSDRLMQVTKGMTITVRYFKEDTAHPEVPAVGNYITLTGKADRIDPVFRTLQVGDTVSELTEQNLTRQQAEQEMACLRKIYASVRLLDPKMLAEEPCYPPWKNVHPCTSCVGREAMAGKCHF